MFAENNKLRDFHGITAWHKAGYTGKGMVAGLGEDFVLGGKRSHAYQTYEVLKEVAPDCDIAFISTYGCQDENYMSEQIQAMKDLGVCAWSISQDIIEPDKDPIDRYKVAPFEKVKDFCTCFCCIGNEGSYDVFEFTKAPYVYGVGALKILNGEPVPEHFSSYSTDNLDFSACNRWRVSSGDLSGTSFSSPALAGITLLVNQFFKDKTGKVLGSDAMYRFLKDNTVDFWYEGKDVKTGWGYVVLPNPDKIDISLYIDAPSPTPKIIYRVQVGAFTKKENALSLCLKIQTLNDSIGAGYAKAFVKEINGVYKVQVGAFSKKTGAEAVKSDLISKGFAAFITTT